MKWKQEMEKNNSENNIIATSIMSVLPFIFFLATTFAKLTGIINLHWFWVITSLWWGPIIAVFFSTVLYFLVFGIVFFFAFFFKNRRDR